MRDGSPLDDGRRMVTASRVIARTAAKYARRLKADDLEGDIVGEAWVELLASAHRWSPDLGGWEGYVLTIAGRTARRVLYLARSPVSGSPCRASKWSAGLRSEGEEALAFHACPAPAPDAFAIDAQFMDALRGALMDTPGCELALGVLLDGETPAEVAARHRVEPARVRAAVRAAREQAVAALGHFAPGHGSNDGNGEGDEA